MLDKPVRAIDQILGLRLAHLLKARLLEHRPIPAGPARVDRRRHPPMHLGHIPGKVIARTAVRPAMGHLALAQRPAVDIDQQRALVFSRPILGFEHMPVDGLSMPILIAEILGADRGQLVRLFGMGIGQHDHPLALSLNREQLARCAEINIG